MTASEFKLSISEGVIGNLAQKVLINYNAYGTLYKVDAIAVRIEGGNLLQLQQATTISLKGPLGDTLNILVDNSSAPVREVDRQIINQPGTQGSYYLYSILTENQRVSVLNPNSQYVTDDAVIIEPGINSTPQVEENYGAVQGTIDRSRESDYIVHSDRAYAISGSKTNPVNLTSIIANQAQPAPVQDSNYTSTGWINGRYEGSKLTSVNNHGASPFLKGEFFQGAFFGKNITDLYIKELPPSDLSYGEYFFSGELDTLRYELEDTFLKVDTPVITGTTSGNLELISQTAYKTPKVLNTGDLLLVQTPSATSPKTEVLQILMPTGSQQYAPYDYYNYNSGTGVTEVHMQVKRGVNGTTKISPFVQGDLVFRVVPTKVYTITGNAIQAVQEGKIRASDSNEVVYIGPDGFVYSASIQDYL